MPILLTKEATSLLQSMIDVQVEQMIDYAQNEEEALAWARSIDEIAAIHDLRGGAVGEAMEHWKKPEPPKAAHPPGSQLFTCGGKEYAAYDNGCYWELHVKLDDGSWHEFTHDDPLWENPELVAAYHAIQKEYS